jgi:hypothetical protein
MKNAVFWMLYSMALERTEVSEEPSASIIRVTRNGGPGTMLAVTINQRTLQRRTKRDGGARFLRNIDSYKRHTA